MFAIKRDLVFYSTEGGFVAINSYRLIKWFPLYISASQMVGKLDIEGDRVVVVSAVEVLEELIKSVSGLAPELLEFRVTKDTAFLRDVRDLTVLRGGIIECRERIQEQKVLIESLERDKRHLIGESEKLGLLMEEYQKTVKQLS